MRLTGLTRHLVEGQAGRDRELGAVDVVQDAWLDADVTEAARLDGEPELSPERGGKSCDCDRRSSDDHALDPVRIGYRALVVLEREANLVGEAPRGLNHDLACLGDDLRLAFDVLDLALEADVPEPLTGVFERQAPPLRERRRHRLEPVRENAVEEAGASGGDREVGQATDVAVEGSRDRSCGGPVTEVTLRSLLFDRRIDSRQRGRVERAHDRKCREVDELGSEPGLPHRSEQLLDGLTANGDDQHADVRPSVPGETLQHAMVEHRLVERHRKLFLRLEADRGIELVLVVDRRELDHPHDDSLVRHSQADVPRELALGEEDLQLPRRGRRRRRPLRRGTGPAEGRRSPPS